MTDEPTKKDWYLSKTLWFNVLFGVIAIVFPKMKEMLPEDMFETVIVAVNLILRFITKDKLIV